MATSPHHFAEGELNKFGSGTQFSDIIHALSFPSMKLFYGYFPNSIVAEIYKNFMAENLNIKLDLKK